MQLTVQETSARLALLRTRLCQQKTLFETGVGGFVAAGYESGGIAKFNYLTSVDELQRLSLRLPKPVSNSATTGQAARRVSSNSRQILSLEAQLTGLLEQQRNLT